MRFQAPARAAVHSHRFGHPLYADFARHRALLLGPAWPSIDALNACWTAPRHRYAAQDLHFVTQHPTLLTDGLHYEERIYAAGAIATRAASWHDLFNALIWFERFALKCAVNAAYVREFARRGAEPRTRAQCALTHFDEAGAVVVLEDASLLSRWDCHDWAGLLAGADWQHGARLYLFGHALLEQGLVPHSLPVAKCLVITGSGARTTPALMAQLADAIVAGEMLNDPKELRPLPLAGIPGWHPAQATPAFFRDTPCFRPLRPGRRYPAPWSPSAQLITPRLAGGGDLRAAGPAR